MVDTMGHVSCVFCHQVLPRMTRRRNRMTMPPYWKAARFGGTYRHQVVWTCEHKHDTPGGAELCYHNTFSRCGKSLHQESA